MVIMVIVELCEQVVGLRMVSDRGKRWLWLRFFRKVNLYGG